jgi:hypothetical protein
MQIRVRPSRVPQQRCLICTIIADLVEVAQEELREGKLDEVAKGLEMIRAQVTGEPGSAAEGIAHGKMGFRN